MLTFKKRSNIYSNSNKTNVVDLVNKKAISYNWWQYWCEYKGISIFNNYSYSNTTNKHQNDCLRLIEYSDHVFIYTSQSINSNNVIPVTLEYLKDQCQKINIILNKRKSKKYFMQRMDQCKAIIMDINHISNKLNLDFKVETYVKTDKNVLTNLLLT